MVSALYVIGLLAIFAVANATDYCHLKSCQNKPHTVCQYGFFNINQYQCGKIRSLKLTSNEIQEILAAHNGYRAKVASGREFRGSPGPQPAARNLGPLSWDNELAAIAQTWADQCTYRHDRCRDSPKFQVGQNIAYKASTGGYNVKFGEIVTMWYEEVKQFNRNHVKSFPDASKGIGHYTQMMWADTKLLGCGGVRYNPDGQWYTTYLVCNYGPTGNWRGREIYKTR